MEPEEAPDHTSSRGKRIAIHTPHFALRTVMLAYEHRTRPEVQLGHLCPEKRPDVLPAASLE